MSFSLKDLLATHQAGTTGEQAPPENEEIVVEDRQMPRSNMRSGLVRKGTFSMGRTGGNILGLIGDALLVGNGGEAIYNKRLKEARMSEAMASYTDDPEEAIRMLNEIDPGAAAELWQKHQEGQSDAATAKLRTREADDKYEGITHDRALALASAATKATYPTIRKRYYDYYNSRGVAPIQDLPEDFDEAALDSVRRSGIPVKDQVKNEDLADYRDATIGERRYSTDAGIRKTSMTTSAAMQRAVMQEGGRNSRAAAAEAGRDRRNTTKGALSKPAIEVVTGADGRKRVIRK